MDYQEAIEIIEYASACNSENSRLTKALNTAISAMQELQEYKKIGTLEEVREAVKELKLYKDAKLCLIPEDVFSKQCEEVDAYRELGTLEEVRDAAEKQKAAHPLEMLGIFDEKEYECINCGNTVPHMDKYCKWCGKKQDWRYV